MAGWKGGLLGCRSLVWSARKGHRASHRSTKGHSLWGRRPLTTMLDQLPPPAERVQAAPRCGHLVQSVPSAPGLINCLQTPLETRLGSALRWISQPFSLRFSSSPHHLRIATLPLSCLYPPNTASAIAGDTHSTARPPLQRNRISYVKGEPIW